MYMYYISVKGCIINLQKKKQVDDFALENIERMFYNDFTVLTRRCIVNVLWKGVNVKKQNQRIAYMSIV